MSKNFFKVSGRTEVANVKRQFLEKFKISIRFYNGDKLADDRDTLAYLQPKRAKKLEDMTILGHMQVRNLENRLLREYGLKVEFAKEDGSELPHKEVSLRNVLVGNFEHVRKKPTAKSDNVSDEDSGDNLESFEQNGKWGYRDKTTGEIVVEPIYDNCDLEFSDGFAKVQSYSQWGFINAKGKEVVETLYDDCGDYFVEGLVFVENDGKYGFVDTTGKEVIEIKYDEVSDFKDGFAKVELDGKYGFINTDGKEVIEVKYDTIFTKYFSDIMTVELDGEEFYIDTDGERIGQP